jgi:hypothetical protein
VKTPVEGLYISNSTQVYPELNNGESITRLAGQVIDVLLKDLADSPTAAPVRAH